MLFSNQDLIEEKKKLLSHFTSCKDHQLDCSFHGVHFKIFSDNKNFIKNLASYLPNSWLKKCESTLTIYHSSNLETSKDWDDEASSLLHTENTHGQTTAIQRDFAAFFDEQTQTAYTYFEPIIGDGFYNFFRWFLSERLIHLNQCMLHSACILDHEQRAHVFLGPSGAGKTTMTELSSPRTILGDDMNLLKVEKRRVLCSPGAVGGLYLPQVDLDQSFPLAGFYWLQQSNVNNISSLSPIKQYQYLYASLANISWPGISSSSLKQADYLIHSILERFEVKTLHFKKETSVWSII